MLTDEKVVGFVATAKPAESRVFYEETLGLQLLESSDFALVYRAGSTTIRVQKVRKVVPGGYTALGWQVGDIVRTMRDLGSRGARFLRFEGLDQDDLGIWCTPDGSRVAWFRDPDGNMLSITERPVE